MQFERTGDPLKTMNIGSVSNAPYIRSFFMLSIRNSSKNPSVGMSCMEIVMDQKEIIDYLKMVEDKKIDCNFFKVTIIDSDGNESVPRNLEEYRGRYLKYIYYPPIMAMTWSDKVQPEEFIFKIPRSDEF